MTVHLIRTPRPDDSNIYLVSGAKPIIVDAGTGTCSDLIISEIRRLSPEPPAAIVATHCHYDHVGGLKDLMDAFGCEAFAGRLDAPYIRNADKAHTVSGLFGEKMRAVPEVRDLKEGDVIDTGDHSLMVLETPGHTEGGICLYDPAIGALISGDTLFSTGYGRTDFPGGSHASIVDSLLRLSNMDIRGLFPGHGSTCENYTAEDLVDVLRMAGV